MTKRWVLDSGQIADIPKSKALFEELSEFHWQYFSELAFQRNRIREELERSLRESGGRRFTKLDREVRSAAGPLYRLEECVHRCGEHSRAVARRSSGDAVWAHVSEVGHSHYRDQFAPGQRACREESRNSSGSPDQENAPKRQRQLRSCQGVSGTGIPAGTQSAFCAATGPAGGLSRAEADGPRASPDLSFGDRTDDQ